MKIKARTHTQSRRTCARAAWHRVLTGQHEHSPDGEQHEADEGNDALEEDLELLGVEFAAQVVHKGVNLTQAEDTEGSHVLRGLHGLRKTRHWIKMLLQTV